MTPSAAPSAAASVVRPRVGSLFSGVEGFGLGLEAAGFEVAWQVEIDRDAVSVLERHYPNVRRYRDVREIKGAELEPVDVLVGGFPCQDLSVAGARKGLAGERSGLFFEVARIAAETATPWLLLENVDGLLSSWVTHDPPPPDLGVGQRWESDESSSLGIVLSTLANGGYGWAYRVLDAQYFGVAQRRRRAFIVGCLGDTGARAAEVLFEPESVLWDLAACLEAGQGSAVVPENGAQGSGVAAALRTGGYGHGTGSERGDGTDNLIIADTLRSHPRPGSNSVGAMVAGTLSPGAHPGGLNGQDAYNGHLIAGTITDEHGNNHERLVVGPLMASGAGYARTGGPDDSYVIADTVRSHTRPGSNSVGNLALANSVTASAGHHGHSSPLSDGSDNLIAEAVSFNWQAGGGGNDQSFRGKSRQYIERAGDYAGALSTTRHDAVAFTNRGTAADDAHETLRAASHGALPMTSQDMAVRRLTPRECERLMGWPDDHTRYRADGSEIPDGPRYRMIGNGVVAPVARWIGERLRRVMETS